MPDVAFNNGHRVRFMLNDLCGASYYSHLPQSSPFPTVAVLHEIANVEHFQAGRFQVTRSVVRAGVDSPMSGDRAGGKSAFVVDLG